jgi:dTDP-4-dehydrorhamnose 3,5-epimerase
MIVTQTPLQGCAVIEPKVFGDERGFFLETFHSQRYQDLLGITRAFVQDNHSRSARGVLRGMHFQKKRPQGKLVRVVRGAVFDVAVDLRRASPSFGQWFGIELSEENKKQLWVPEGFAHGFVTLSEFADFEYKCTDFYDPTDEGVLQWNDPDVGIQWPALPEVILSAKDKAGTPFQHLMLNF